jgi:hypothetical protein
MGRSVRNGHKILGGKLQGNEELWNTKRGHVDDNENGF